MLTSYLVFLCSLFNRKRIAKGIGEIKCKEIMEAVGHDDSEGIDDLWSVSCKHNVYLHFVVAFFCQVGTPN